MKILFTGGGSFTGYWFIRALAAAGHEVTAVYTKPPEGYSGIRRERMAGAAALAAVQYETVFGDERFLDLIKRERWDALCHHAAHVEGYKEADFDALKAAERNTHSLPLVLAALAAQGCRKVVITGSVFEAGEGDGTQPLRAFSPYGLSKRITAEIFEYYAHRFDLSLGKFVIPNPFGPFEEERFNYYLASSWLKGEAPTVKAPLYVRDNVPVSLLSRAYRDFVRDLPERPGFYKLNPSGYRESQGDFAQRMARYFEKFLSCPCPVRLAEQTDFTEPLERINTEPVLARYPDWDEEAAWEEYVRYYSEFRDRL